METLPPEIQMIIYRFARHPAADPITQSIVEHDEHLHEMAKLNHKTYDVISKDPDYSFHQYLHYEYICRNMIDNYSTAPSLKSHSDSDSDSENDY